MKLLLLSLVGLLLLSGIWVSGLFGSLIELTAFALLALQQWFLKSQPE